MIRKGEKTKNYFQRNGKFALLSEDDLKFQWIFNSQISARRIPEIGDEITSYVGKLINGDKRFFFASPEDVDQNYNYNDNSLLVNAIKRGYRGAFWDILRRISEE